MGGSLKAEGFGDGKCIGSHPQAALEAATLIELNRWAKAQPIFCTDVAVDVIPAKAGNQDNRKDWIPHQVRNDNRSVTSFR
ncbi:MAG TPA: hypothetical protein DIU00_17650 [Phycisphaerales bacterium]|nr:hypothetical protein [Phycisphaerales bacterium]